MKTHFTFAGGLVLAAYFAVMPGAGFVHRRRSLSVEGFTAVSQPAGMLCDLPILPSLPIYSD